MFNFLKINIPLTNAFLDANRVERMEFMYEMDRLRPTHREDGPFGFAALRSVQALPHGKDF